MRDNCIQHRLNILIVSTFHGLFRSFFLGHLGLVALFKFCGYYCWFDIFFVSSDWVCGFIRVNFVFTPAIYLSGDIDELFACSTWWAASVWTFWSWQTDLRVKSSNRRNIFSLCLNFGFLLHPSFACFRSLNWLKEWFWSRWSQIVHRLSFESWFTLHFLKFISTINSL